MDTKNNQKYVVMGLGLHGGGLGVAKWLAQQGHQVLVTDLKSSTELKKSLQPLKNFSNIKYRLGEHHLSDFQNITAVIANPIVRQDNKFIVTARNSGAQIYNDVSFFLTICPCPVIGITGTKGKSTTASLIFQLLADSHKQRVYLGGNIRISPFSFVNQLKKDDLVVLEMSSWQCEGLADIHYSPAIAILTNVGHDHLNTYKNFNAYRAAKLLIFKYQNKSDFAIINKDDQNSQVAEKVIKGQIRKFAIHSGNHFVRGQYLYYQKKKLMPLSQIKLIGHHNLINIITALYVAEIKKLKPAQVRKTISRFTGLAGRLQLIRAWQGKIFINDTTATSPIATIASLNILAKPIVLIAGGSDKKLPYNDLVRLISKKVSYLVLLPGSATEKIKKLLLKNKFKNFQEVDSMKMAVKIAQQQASAKSSIILSPAAASFGLFINEFDRGDQFDKYVKQIKKL